MSTTTQATHTSQRLLKHQVQRTLLSNRACHAPSQRDERHLTSPSRLDRTSSGKQQQEAPAWQTRNREEGVHVLSGVLER